MNPQIRLRRIFLAALLGAAVGTGTSLQAAPGNADGQTESVTLTADLEEAQPKPDLDLLKAFDPYASNLSEDEIIALTKTRLALGAKIDGGPQGNPLHYIISFHSERPIKLVAFLLDHGADPNAREPMPNGYSETPLMALIDAITLNGGFPIMEEDKAMLTLLLGRGAAVNAKDARGWTALHYAALNAIEGAGDNAPSRGKFVALMDILKYYGANPLLKDAEGRTALDLVKAEAPYNKASIAYLQDWEREVTAQAKPGAPKL
jgi:ankyrin repeat protein